MTATAVEEADNASSKKKKKAKAVEQNGAAVEAAADEVKPTAEGSKKEKKIKTQKSKNEA